MTDLTIANTIRDQIGGRALMMIGAKSFVGDERSLSFRIGGNAKRVSGIRIVLDPSDTYTVTYFRVRGSTVTTVAEETDVYVDALHASIERNTGMYTSL